jgi:hypothetical protein
MRKALRLVASLVLLMSLALLVVDLAFLLCAPKARGGAVYLGVQFSALLGLTVALVRGKIALYNGPPANTANQVKT